MTCVRPAVPVWTEDDNEFVVLRTLPEEKMGPLWSMPEGE
jgi:hypothetical protein